MASKQVVALQDALNAVGTTAQAVAVADLCLSTLKAVSDHFDPFTSSFLNSITLGLYGIGNPDRAAAVARLGEAKLDVQRYRDPMVGRDAPVNLTEWDALRHAIEWAYDAMWSIEAVQGDDDEFANFVAWVGSTTADSIANIPGVASAAIGAVTTEATDLTGGILAGLVKGLWPVLLIAGAALAVGIVVLGSGGVAGVAKKVVG